MKTDRGYKQSFSVLKIFALRNTTNKAYGRSLTKTLHVKQSFFSEYCTFLFGPTALTGISLVGDEILFFLVATPSGESKPLDRFPFFPEFFSPVPTKLVLGVSFRSEVVGAAESGGIMGWLGTSRKSFTGTGGSGFLCLGGCVDFGVTKI